MTVEQIMIEFGDELSREAKQKLNEKSPRLDQDSGAIYVRVPNTRMYDDTSGKVNVSTIPSVGILGGLEVTPMLPYETDHYSSNHNMITVYEC
jgi:hypothetical protein